MKYYLNVLRNYATFTGRARRSEYWFYTLFTLIFIIIAAVLDNVLGLAWGAGPIKTGPIYLVYGLATFIPGLAVTVRRLHDTNRSGWFLLLYLLPFIGWIWLLVLMFLDSTPGDNKYGANPKQGEASVATA